MQDYNHFVNQLNNCCLKTTKMIVSRSIFYAKNHLNLSDLGLSFHFLSKWIWPYCAPIG